MNMQESGIRYLGNLPFDHVPAALASCDVLAMPYRHSAFLDMAASCKIAEYLASGRPIVATRTPNLMANFPEAAIKLQAVLALPANVVDIARTIRTQVAQRISVELPEGMDWGSIANALAHDLSLSGEQMHASQV
jgi:glycosyltransferase involved in cell wall biosynthesis